VFASEIVDQNKRAEAGGFAPINLKSVLIGNGLTDFKTWVKGYQAALTLVPFAHFHHFRTFESYYEIQCKNLTMVPFQDIGACVGMKQAVSNSRCELWNLSG
jgi:carboxypeptidase C (cathepsin A)